MKKILLLIFLSVNTLAFAQVTISPAAFEVGTEITITIDANSTATDCNGFNNPSKVYLHSGIGPDSNPWTSVVGNWGQDDGVGEMTSNGDGTWSITFTPENYYSLTTEQHNAATVMGMVFRNESGSQEFKDNGCSDFFFDIGTYQLTLNSPSQNTTIVNAGINFTISATTTLNSSFTLTTNSSVIDNSVVDATDYSFSYVVNTTTNFELEATNGSDTLSETFTLAVSPIVTEETVPAGLLDGINFDENDPTKATLVLYAPMKEFVHVIGDFNNWEIDDTYLMKKDSFQDRFWIELTGLTPNYDHLYQYLVEFDINIADPYSTLILDGYGNDDHINSTTFPNLPRYPSGQSHAVTVLRTGEADYDWQVTDFQGPEKEDLIIYEILIRDFDELHSFDAVKNRLDYLEELGVNAIELMPVNEFDGNESWGYNPSFHMALDKYYGTKDALKSLIDECHVRGIAVIIDVVYNHASGQHPYYRMWNTDNGGTGGQASVDSPFFNATATHSYSVFNDFNHQQQATKDYVNRTVTYWIEEFKIDGMRWDLTKGFTQNCTSSDESCTNSTQTDRIEVLQGYADNQWVSDEDFYVIFEHLGGINEEEQWANYRIDEDKGILLWNKMTEPYNEATMGYHTGGDSNFSNVSYSSKGFDHPSAISYMESHDEERLMYKNLQFGNSEGSYDVTDESIALSRIQTAGAFFFTVPGPKMIWQFGELGYDISIDENGRTGNKPILWEYMDEPHRYAIYETWSDLIKLKLEEPIFKTSDFSMALSASTGLKTIHLTDGTATGDAIQYVTIIGNFGLTEQEINPNFQETGTWYNLLNNNQPKEVTNITDPINLQPGEFIIFADNPSIALIDPDDLDADGVTNVDDLCSNTPFGATVDVNGCEIFTLPADNFTINSFSETCRSSNNGSISITATENYNYTATLSGTGEIVNEFISETEFTNLSAGNYSVCITLEGQSEYEQCFNIVITEPDDLSVSSKVNLSSKSITLNLEGASVFHVTLNEQAFTTTENVVDLKLTQPSNKLTVRTDKDCQGTYEETVLLSNLVRLYPNPITEDTINIFIGESDLSQARLELIELSGKMISSKTYPIESGIIKMDVSNISNGLFLLNIHTSKNTFNYKLIN